jgi:hypothetical protein
MEDRASKRVFVEEIGTMPPLVVVIASRDEQPATANRRFDPDVDAQDGDSPERRRAVPIGG